MSKHVKGVEGQNNNLYNNTNNFWLLQHASTYITFDDMVKKPYVSAFQTFFPDWKSVDIKKVMSKNIMGPYSIFWVSFDTFNMLSIKLIVF